MFIGNFLNRGKKKKKALICMDGNYVCLLGKKKPRKMGFFLVLIAKQLLIDVLTEAQRDISATVVLHFGNKMTSISTNC